MEVEAITELTKEIRALPLATVAFVAVIVALAVVGLVVVVGGRGNGRFFQLLQPLTEAVNRFTAMFDRRMDETNTREMFQTQMMMSTSVGLQNVSHASGRLVQMAEKTYNRMVARDTLDAARHDELLAAIRANTLSDDRIKQIVLQTVDAGRDQLRAELRAMREDITESMRPKGADYVAQDVGDSDGGVDAGTQC